MEPDKELEMPSQTSGEENHEDPWFYASEEPTSAPENPEDDL